MASTILDVAKLCGYSKSTVSRVFQCPDAVPDATRNKVFEAARVLEYTPNAIARAMVRRRTDNIAFIISEQQYPVISNPFYSPVLESILHIVNRENYSLFISSDAELRLQDGRNYKIRQMDGIIIAGQTDAQIVLGVKKLGIPVVLLNNDLKIDDIICIRANHYGGAVKAMEHLIQRGYQKIGLIAGKFSSYVYFERYNAYIDVLKKNGIKVDYRFVQSIEPTVEDACGCVSTLLSMPDRPDALFCTNDMIAVGAIKAAIRMGMRIPQDIAIVGYDASHISRLIEPELTTVKVDTESMGQWAAKTLIALMRGEPVERTDFEASTELIIRKTT